MSMAHDGCQVLDEDGSGLLNAVDIARLREKEAGAGAGP
jgi:hypothetical protein